MSRTDKDRPWQIRANDQSEPNPISYFWHSDWHHRTQRECGELCGWTLPHWYLSTPPHDFIHAVWWGPERARESTRLRSMTKEFNAGDLVTDDFPNFQHRSGGKRLYW